MTGRTWEGAVKAGFAGACISLAVFFLALLAAGASFWHNETAWLVVSSTTFRSSLWLSFWTATLATLLAMLLGLPAAYYLSRTRSRGKNAIDTLLDLPTILSPIATGTLLLMFFHTYFGRWVQSHVAVFVYTVLGIVLAQFTIVVSLAVRLLKSTFDSIPKRYEDLGRLLGCGPFNAFLRVSLPMARPGINAALIICWARAFGEFGATVTLAGAMPRLTETVPTGIYLRLGTADLEGAVILIAVLVGVSMAVLFALRQVSRFS